MLEPWSLTQGKLKKQFALKLFQLNDLKKATCIHATAPMEVENIRDLGFKNPIAMIPNGVNIDEFPTSFPEKGNKTKKILFLSRIHVKKGIENLIEAWKLIDTELKKDWKIEIVGNGDQNYIKSLKEKIVLENLTGEIEIKKPVFGKDKIKLFREASLFVLPTFSENFGIVIAEALASYTPVITTKGTPWEDLNESKSGWWIDIGVAPLKLALEEALSTKEQDLLEMGVNGRKLIENKYSMNSVGKQMIELYDWILKKNSIKPKFVDIYE
jgi:glycosyltransferase involved in cell wall biosynthesis